MYNKEILLSTACLALVDHVFMSKTNQNRLSGRHVQNHFDDVPCLMFDLSVCVSPLAVIPVAVIDQ